VHFEALSSQLLRALRGRRTQKALSQRLGFRSNVANAWETGRDFPRASTFFRLIRLTGRDGPGALTRFRPELEVVGSLEEPTSAGAILEMLRGKRKIGELAATANLDRFLVSRILKGRSDPRLPDFLALLEALTLSCLDFMALFVDVGTLPECGERWGAIEAARRAAYEFPWAQALVLLTDLPEYAALPAHRPGWFAARLGLTTHEEDDCLKLLVTLGRLRFDAGKYVRARGSLAVDTRNDREQTRRLGAHWMNVAAGRLLGEGGVRFAFNVFGVNRADAERLRELQRRYFAELRTIVAASEPTEVALVAQFSLMDL
jgi:Domain of unknown function (DUF4423)